MSDRERAPEQAKEQAHGGGAHESRPPLQDTAAEAAAAAEKEAPGRVLPEPINWDDFWAEGRTRPPRARQETAEEF